MAKNLIKVSKPLMLYQLHTSYLTQFWQSQHLFWGVPVKSHTACNCRLAMDHTQVYNIHHGRQQQESESSIKGGVTVLF